MIGVDRQLFDWAPDGIVLHDGDRVVAANAASLRLTGAHRQEELVGMHIASLLDHPYLLAVEQHLLDAHADTDPARVVRDRLHRLDGATRDVEVRTQLLLVAGVPQAQVILRDVTERLAAERRKRADAQAEQTERQRREVRVLAGGVARQLTNALHVILGFASVLAEDLPAQQQQEVTAIMEAATHAARITRLLMQFARQAPCTPQTVDLLATVRRVVEALPATRVTGAPRITVSAEDCGLVRVDPDHLQQILVQLVENATHASATHGEIHITVRGERSSGEHASSGNGDRLPQGAYAVVTVHDSGTGMTPEVGRHLFEPFFSTSAAEGGTGLGLAAVEGMVAQNHGRLLMESAPDAGSSFTLLLPVVGSSMSSTSWSRAPDALAGTVHAAPLGGNRGLSPPED